MPVIYPYPLTKAQHLVIHPSNNAPAVKRIQAQLIQLNKIEILFDFCLWGDMARLRIPPSNRSDQQDLLWQHTCFEAFVTQPDSKAYREFNFSPSGAWACYDFSDYRQPCAPTLPIIAPSIETLQTEGRLELKARLSITTLATDKQRKNLQMGLTAVIETQDVAEHAHSYWALEHQSNHPDFHQRAGFTLNTITLVS